MVWPQRMLTIIVHPQHKMYCSAVRERIKKKKKITTIANCFEAQSTLLQLLLRFVLQMAITIVQSVARVSGISGGSALIATRHSEWP